MKPISKAFEIHPGIAQALRVHYPVVALESAVITHGLPRPQNLELAQQLETEVRSQSVLPATIGLLNGKIHIGMDEIQLQHLANAEGARKISRRDFGIAISRHEMGGTTVAGTLIAAHTAGIQVFATGGIGGVHRNAPFDISADLLELGRIPMIVVCAGAKSILDLPATLEVLETQGVPVLGYQTNDFPAFFSTSSGLKVTQKIETPREAAEIAQSQWGMGLNNAILVVVPPPPEFALPYEQVEIHIQHALEEADKNGIRGAAVTPFLLQRVNQLSGGTSMKANLALLRNNARIAAQIARCLSLPIGQLI